MLYRAIELTLVLAENIVEIKTQVQRMLFNTIRMETFDIHGQPVGVGTSFMLSHSLRGYGNELFLVANKHVIEGAYTTIFQFVPVRGGRPDYDSPVPVKLDQFESSCHGHPDENVDVAICPISWILDMISVDGLAPYLHEVTTDMLPSLGDLGTVDVGDEVLFIGYPNGLYDRKNNVPIVRRGTTATPLALDYDGAPVFLIDASVFPGSSGSPVFTYIPRRGAIGSKLNLLGVVASVFYRTNKGDILQKPAPVQVGQYVEIKELIDLGVVFKASTIVETIEDFWEEHKDRAGELREYKEAMIKRFGKGAND